MNRGKKYSAQEDQVRKSIYEKSHAAIEAHNKKHAAGLESYAMAHTQFSDLVKHKAVANFKRKTAFNEYYYYVQYLYKI